MDRMEILKKNVTMGLVNGRHEMPVKEYIFDSIENPLDYQWLSQNARISLETHFPEATIATNGPACQADYTDIPCYYRGRLHLYVTGLTSALICVLNECAKMGISVTTYNYDMGTGEYKPLNVIR